MGYHPQKGFSLIELAIVVALLGVLLSVGLPAVADWIATQRVRTAAEGVLNGLQLARGEAVRSNTLVNLQIGADGISWNVVNNGTTVQTRGADAGGGVTAAPAGAATITFNGVGRMVTPNTGTFAIRYTSSVNGVRAMCVAVMANTPRMCDPLLADGDVRSCWTTDALGARVMVAGC